MEFRGHSISFVVKSSYLDGVNSGREFLASEKHLQFSRREKDEMAFFLQQTENCRLRICIRKLEALISKSWGKAPATPRMEPGNRSGGKLKLNADEI